MWNTKQFDFGIVKTNQEISCTFVYTGEIPIKSVHPDCGCTSVINKNNTILVKLTVPHIPGHLKILGSNFYDTKYITVTLQDNSKQILTIKYTVLNESNFKRNNDKRK